MEERSVLDAPVGYSLGYQLNQLRAACKPEEDWPDPRAAFAYYVCGTDLELPVDELLIPVERLRDTPVLASCGYLIGIDPDLLGDDLMSSWNERAPRRFEQAIISRERHSFFFRPYDLLGIALGLQQSQADMSPQIEMLRQAMQEGPKHYADTTLERQIVASVAAHVTEAEWPLPAINIEDGEIDILCLLYWTISVFPRLAGKMNIDDHKLALVDRITSRALREALLDQKFDVQNIAVVYYALDSIVRNNIERLQLGYRSSSRKESALKREEHVEELERSIEHVRSWIERKAKCTQLTVRVVLSGLGALLLAPIELLLLGVFGGVQDPLPLLNLPSKLWVYATGNWLPLIVVAVVTGGIAFGLYYSSPIQNIATYYGRKRKKRLCRELLGASEAS